MVWRYVIFFWAASEQEMVQFSDVCVVEELSGKCFARRLLDLVKLIDSLLVVVDCHCFDEADEAGRQVEEGELRVSAFVVCVVDYIGVL